jgi:hypothetical protein
MSKEHVTFSINYGNSYAQEYTGMDVIYAALKITTGGAYVQLGLSELLNA